MLIYERADVFDEISLLSSPFCSSFFFSRFLWEKTKTKRERSDRVTRNTKSPFVRVFFEERERKRRYDDNDFQSSLSTSPGSGCDFPTRGAIEEELESDSPNVGGFRTRVHHVFFRRRWAVRVRGRRRCRRREDGDDWFTRRTFYLVDTFSADDERTVVDVSGNGRAHHLGAQSVWDVLEFTEFIVDVLYERVG